MTFLYPIPKVTTMSRGYHAPDHLGIDFAQLQPLPPLPIGTPVYASESGVVIQSSFEPGDGAFGNVVVLRHDQIDTGKGAWRSLYGHLSERLKQVGDRVAQGQLVGLSGTTSGYPGAGPHLHFQIMDGPGNNSTNTVDPLPLLQAPPVKPNTEDDVNNLTGKVVSHNVPRGDGQFNWDVYRVGSDGKLRVTWFDGSSWHDGAVIGEGFAPNADIVLDREWKPEEGYVQMWVEDGDGTGAAHVYAKPGGPWIVERHGAASVGPPLVPPTSGQGAIPLVVESTVRSVVTQAH